MKFIKASDRSKHINRSKLQPHHHVGSRSTDIDCHGSKMELCYRATFCEASYYFLSFFVIKKGDWPKELRIHTVDVNIRFLICEKEMTGQSRDGKA